MMPKITGYLFIILSLNLLILIHGHCVCDNGVADNTFDQSCQLRQSFASQNKQMSLTGFLTNQRCQSCDLGYILGPSKICEKIPCSCENGRLKKPAICLKIGDQKCESCNEGYHLKRNDNPFFRSLVQSSEVQQKINHQLSLANLQFNQEFMLYTGEENEDWLNRTCLFWKSELSKIESRVELSKFPVEDLIHHNFCRSFEFGESPWCFVKDLSNSGRIEKSPCSLDSKSSESAFSFEDTKS